MYPISIFLFLIQIYFFLFSLLCILLSLSLSCLYEYPSICLSLSFSHSPTPLPILSTFFIFYFCHFLLQASHHINTARSLSTPRMKNESQTLMFLQFVKFQYATKVDSSQFLGFKDHELTPKIIYMRVSQKNAQSVL